METCQHGQNYGKVYACDRDDVNDEGYCPIHA